MTLPPLLSTLGLALSTQYPKAANETDQLDSQLASVIFFGFGRLGAALALALPLEPGSSSSSSSALAAAVDQWQGEKLRHVDFSFSCCA